MKWVYLALLAVFSLEILPPFAAQGEQPASITLQCTSTSTPSGNAKPDPITGDGMTVDFQERTVSFNSFHVPIERADATLVLFHGEQTTRFEHLTLTVDGSIDLVTGRASLTFAQAGHNMTWKLTCRPLGLL
jgi:hypothetical protein